MLLRTAPLAGNVLEIWILGLRTIVLGGGSQKSVFYVLQVILMYTQVLEAYIKKIDTSFASLFPSCCFSLSPLLRDFKTDRARGIPDRGLFKRSLPELKFRPWVLSILISEGRGRGGDETCPAESEIARSA